MLETRHARKHTPETAIRSVFYIEYAEVDNNPAVDEILASGNLCQLHNTAWPFRPPITAVVFTAGPLDGLDESEAPELLDEDITVSGPLDELLVVDELSGTEVVDRLILSWVPTIFMLPDVLELPKPAL